MYSLRSDRVIARKLKREQKKGEGGEGGERGNLFLPPPPLPFLSLFLLLSRLSRRARSEPLATQARREVHTVKRHFLDKTRSNWSLGEAYR